MHSFRKQIYIANELYIQVTHNLTLALRADV